MESQRIFTVDELNRMLLEAMSGDERTSITGPGAQEKFKKVAKEVAQMRRVGAVPEPLQD